MGYPRRMRTTALMLGGFVLLLAASAGAQPRGVRTRWSQRSLTMPSRTLRIDLAPPDYALLDSGAIGEGYGFRFHGYDGNDPDDDPDEVVVTSGVGLAFGITPAVEVGAKLLPIRFTPNPDYLDLELYLRWAFVRTRAADVGVQFGMQLPTDSPRLFGSSVGLPVRIRMGDVGRLDLGIELEVLFWDADGDGDVDVDGNVDLPMALSFSVTERFYLGGQFGLFIYDFDTVSVRGGGHVGFTVGRGSPLVDFTASFNVFGAGRYTPRDGRWAGGPRRWEAVAGIRLHFGL